MAMRWSMIPTQATAEHASIPSACAATAYAIHTADGFVDNPQKWLGGWIAASGKEEIPENGNREVIIGIIVSDLTNAAIFVILVCAASFIVMWLYASAQDQLRAANAVRLACWAAILIALVLALHECNGDLARVMTL